MLQPRMAATGIAAPYPHTNMIQAFTSKSMELKWITIKTTTITKKTTHLKKHRQNNLSLKPLLPLYISTDPRHVDLHHLQNLSTTCNHSFNNNTPEIVDINKLRIAMSHSDVLVSVFCKAHDVDGFAESSMMDFFTPVSPSRDLLVGFGRAVSDFGLTASIYDLMVIPSLQRMGIGKMIVKKIVRMLTNRDIYDIAALCSEDERLFFKACGFGGDILDSTTMMYTRTASSTTQVGEQTISRAGQKLLLIPPLIQRPNKSSGTIM